MRRKESGFTLVEVLVVVVMLGAVGYALTQSVILAWRTTDGTAAAISRSVASGSLGSYFPRDVQSADNVSTADPTCARSPSAAFISFSWTDGTARTVSYALDPPAGLEQDLIRWSCGEDSAEPDRQVLGHFSRGPGDPVPVAVTCTPACDGSPSTVTLQIEAGSGRPPDELTVRPRVGA